MKIVVESADAVAAVITERERAGASRVRPMMLAFIHAWSGGSEVLGGLARVDGQLGADAKAMSDALFADGVSFVKLDANAAWFEGQRRLDRIDKVDESDSDSVERFRRAMAPLDDYRASRKGRTDGDEDARGSSSPRSPAPNDRGQERRGAPRSSRRPPAGCAASTPVRCRDHAVPRMSPV